MSKNSLYLVIFINRVNLLHQYYMKINPTKIGQALADLGFEQIRRKNGRFWKVAERPQSEIDSRIPDVDHSENEETDMPF